MDLLPPSSRLVSGQLILIQVTTSRVLWFLAALACHAMHPHDNPNKTINHTVSVCEIEIQYDNYGEGARRRHSDIVNIITRWDTLSTDRSGYHLIINECPQSKLT